MCDVPAIQAILRSAMGFAVLSSSGSCPVSKVHKPAHLHKPRKLRRNAKENKNVLMEKEGKEVIFLTFPCRALSSITSKSTQACICKYMYTELLQYSEEIQEHQKAPTEPPQNLAPVPNLTCLPFQSMSARLHQLHCINGAVAELMVTSGQDFTHSVHCVSTEQSSVCL